jgi:hypothetical protein
MDKADLFDKLSRIRRQTVNRDVLDICDALAAYMTNPIVTSQDAIAPPPSRDAVPSPSADCQVCAARRKAEAARSKKARNRRGKGATSRQSKGALRPIIPTTNNAPATS